MTYPIILQKTHNSCGPTCIYMLCEYYSIPYNKKEILQIANMTPSGTSIWYMQKVLRHLGFSCEAIKTEDFYQYDYNFPVIAIINSAKTLLHYVIIYKRNINILLIADPAFGLQNINIKKFLSNFTGMLIIPIY